MTHIDKVRDNVVLAEEALVPWADNLKVALHSEGMISSQELGEYKDFLLKSGYIQAADSSPDDFTLTQQGISAASALSLTDAAARWDTLLPNLGVTYSG